MTQLLFRNRWFALLWALALCFTISRFFGDGGGQEQLAKAADDIRSKRAAAQAQSMAQAAYEEAEAAQQDGEALENGEYSDSPASEIEAY
jgi:hypothetical protein